MIPLAAVVDRRKEAEGGGIRLVAAAGREIECPGNERLGLLPAMKTCCPRAEEVWRGSESHPRLKAETRTSNFMTASANRIRKQMHDSSGIGTYRCSLSVVILTGVPRRCGANGPFTVSVDFQLSAPELAAEPCRSATTSRLVIVVGCAVSAVVYLLPFETVRGASTARRG